MGSTFLSAFLLFQIQLILGKYLLPWFGGAPAVWTTCILFFQGYLLIGYAYAFYIDGRFSPRGQVKLHGTLLLASLAILVLAWLSWGSPLLPAGNWKPEAGAGHPVASLLGILLVSVGLTYPLLAANSPLVQRWFSLARPGTIPYRLYSVSNTGSLLALLSYPFLVEPNGPLRLQAIVWACLYGLFAAATFACMARVWTTRDVTFPEPVPSSMPAGTAPASPLMRIFWLVLAACPSCMLLAITNDLSQEVAVTPFIWVLPLAIYLLSFIVCFDHARWYNRRFFVLLTYATSMVVLITILKGFHLGILAHLAAYSAFLFSFCMLCHGELYRLRPGADKLTHFYLTVALGGLAGGVLVGILAPMFFRGYWEFHIAILVSLVLLAVIFWSDKESFLNRGDRWHFFGLIFLLAYILTHYGLHFLGGYELPVLREHREPANLTLAVVVTLLLYLPFRARSLVRSPLWPRLLLGLLVFVVECFTVYQIRSNMAQSRVSGRNFFGVVKVRDEPLPFGELFVMRSLVHGKIIHGYQFQSPDLELVPTAYYVADSGVGEAFRIQKSRRQDSPLRVGVTGLGTGALSTYVGSGDFLRFYEINPLVVDYAFGPQAWFSYLNKCRATVEIVPGDARLSMEEELDRAEPGTFDLLVLDAFSSDSVPLHLLTREAFGIYRDHLRDEGSIIAVNITNKILDLRDPVLSMAREMGMEAVVIRSSGDFPIPAQSTWILMSKGREFHEDSVIQAALPSDRNFRNMVWTDDFSNLWKVLR